MNLSQSDYRFQSRLYMTSWGFFPRRDGIGSFGFLMKEQMVYDELFPFKRALIGGDAGGLTHKMVTIQNTSISKETNVLP